MYLLHLLSHFIICVIMCVLQFSQYYETSVSSNHLIMELTNLLEVIWQKCHFFLEAVCSICKKGDLFLGSLNYFVFSFHLIFHLNYFLSVHPFKCYPDGNPPLRKITTFTFNSRKTVYKS